MTEVERQRLAGLGRLITDTDDFERLGIAVRNTLHHIGDERSGKTVKRSVLAFVIGTGHMNYRTVDGDADVFMNLCAESSLRSFDRDDIAVIHCNGNAGGNGNFFSSNS